VLAAVAFLAAYAWLRDAAILLQHQGSQLVRAAHSVREGAGLMVSASEPLARYGPLYALLLAPLDALGLSVGGAAYLLNCLAWAACFPLLAALGRELGARSSAPLLALWASFAPGLYLVRAVRPDLLPVALSLAAALALLRRAREGGRHGPWIIGLACGLAGLARYMACFTLLPVMVVGVWLTPAVDRRRRWLDTAIALALGAGPMVAWAARNLLLTGYATGMSRSEPREVWGEAHTLFENLGLLARTLVLDGFSWAGLGVRLWEGERPGVALAFVGAASSAALLATAAAAVRGRGGEAREGRDHAAERRAVTLCLGFIGCYLGMLLLLWTLGNNDPINTRYVAPVYPFLLALAARVLARARDLPARWPGAAAAVGLLLVAAPNAVKSVRLLLPDPGPQLIEVRVWENRPPTWRHAIDWDNVRRLRDPRDRVYAEAD
jgi:4-amino-4-deoxy-L-arabinose transferase-like glycosyltransferase